MIASKNLPFVGRLTYLITNWEKITQEEWVLYTIQDFRCQWELYALSPPAHTLPPPAAAYHHALLPIENCCVQLLI